MSKGKRFAEPENSKDKSIFGKKKNDDDYYTDELFIKNGYNPNSKDTSSNNEFNSNFEFEDNSNSNFDQEHGNFDIDEFSTNYNAELDDDDKKEKIIKIIAIIITIVVVIAAIVVVYNYINTKNNVEVPVENTSLESDEMIASIEGYDVLGKLIIEKANIDQYILDSSEDNALQKGIGKLYGPALNSTGNLCLVGHNYDTMLEKLTEIVVGDEITLVDKYNEKTKYKVTKNYYTEPDNLECLLQPTDKVELTIITCVHGSTQRLVVKAEKEAEVEIESSIENDTIDNENSNEEDV